MDKERIIEIKEELENIEKRSEYSDVEYDEYLDDVTDGDYLVKTYSASRILKEVDPIVYNIGKTEYWDEKIFELEEELKELENAK